MSAYSKNTSGYFSLTPSAGGASWSALTEAHTAGAVASVGPSIASVNTPWAQSGNNLTCNITSNGADGLNEGYTYAVPATALFTSFNVTEADMINGKKTLIVSMRLRSDPGLAVSAGVFLARSTNGSGATNSLFGGGGGFFSNGINVGTITGVAIDSNQDNINSFYVNYLNCAPVVSITSYKAYWKAYATLQVDGQDYLDLAAYNFSGVASLVETVWLVFWAGGSSGRTLNLDMDVWFAMVDGPNFGTVPA